jgi:hypothetical protein
MSAHVHCGAAGKYNCHYDSWVHGELLSHGGADDEFGDVNDYGVWTGRLDLEAECEGHEHDPSNPASVAGVTMTCDGSCRGDEHRASLHYGGPFLIIQEGSSGFVTIVGYAEATARDAEYDRLFSEYDQWVDPEPPEAPVTYPAGDWRRA